MNVTEVGVWKKSVKVLTDRQRLAASWRTVSDVITLFDSIFSESKELNRLKRALIDPANFEKRL